MNSQIKFLVETLDIDEHSILVLRPERKMTDPEYDGLKTSMEELGAHWRERVHGFALPIDNIKRVGYTQQQEDIQFFPTPKSVAERVVKLSGLNDYEYKWDNPPFVLEPSAGHGALLDEIKGFIRNVMRVQVIEPDYDNARVLNDKGYIVEEETFEEYYNKHKKEKVFTHVIMNPPFSNQRDIKHVMMAYDLLKHGGVLVAVISENSLYYNTDDTRKFNEWAKKVGVEIEPVDIGAFKNSGTTIDTVIIKAVKE